MCVAGALVLKGLEIAALQISAHREAWLLGNTGTRGHLTISTLKQKYYYIHNVRLPTLYQYWLNVKTNFVSALQC